jgi:hypothetical protein
MFNLRLSNGSLSKRKSLADSYSTGRSACGVSVLGWGTGTAWRPPTGPVNVPLPSPSGDTSNRCASARRWAIFRLADRTSRAASFSRSVLADLRKSPAYRWRSFSMIPSSGFFDPAARLTCGHKNWRTRPHHSVVYRMWLVHRQSIDVEILLRRHPLSDVSSSSSNC